MTALAPVLEGFFTDRLTALRASAHTIAAYRDTYRLLLTFAQRRTSTPPARLDLAALDATMIRAFLDHLETERHNGIATRNLRLNAIHSLFRYAALRCPEHAALIQQVLAIPPKRADVPLVTYLTHAENEALLAAPDRTTLVGRRDHLLLTVGVQTGLRVSELIALNRGDIMLGTGAHLRCEGKGRRERTTPITRSTARLLQAWFTERHLGPDDPVFATRAGRRLTVDAVAKRLDTHLAAAGRRCPSLTAKNVTPHTLRHTCAMNLLHAGVDPSSIALWLGHATTRSTDTYLHADLATKERALALVAPTPAAAHRYRPPDRLLAFLEAL
ncbi:MAG TPA: tyrosine-type recombinase/integrase [Mycobacteriales bacterium]|nr:tyrosine-type recombinase/integrase [Mycobacteriales bacterium]